MFIILCDNLTPSEPNQTKSNQVRQGSVVDATRYKIIIHNGLYLHGNKVWQYRQYIIPYDVLQQFILLL